MLTYLLMKDSMAFSLFSFKDTQVGAQRKVKLKFNPFFSMFPFDPPENVKKTSGFRTFSGESKGNFGKKRVNSFLANVLILYPLKRNKTKCFSNDFYLIALAG